MSSLLNVENLKVSYGAIQAIKGISFYVNKGEIVSLIGANGAGKTSTLRAISGLVKAEGRIDFSGQDFVQMPSYQRVSHGLAQSPEGRGVFAQMSVLENLEMGAYSRSLSSKNLALEID
ncbi:MAG: ATP-binding cassette domain-containing protein, partial [Pseudobdellovibrionaceae bacterium]